MGLSIDPSKFEALVMMLVGQVKGVENQERIILWPFMCVKKWRIFVGIFMMIFASFGIFYFFSSFFFFCFHTLLHFSLFKWHCFACFFSDFSFSSCHPIFSCSKFVVYRVYIVIIELLLFLVVWMMEQCCWFFVLSIIAMVLKEDVLGWLLLACIFGDFISSGRVLAITCVEHLWHY